METLQGIFCVEGFWDDDLRVTSTVKPILDLLEKHESYPYIYHSSGTKTELAFLLNRFIEKKYSTFPVLYLSMHGLKNSVVLPTSRGPGMSIEKIGKILNNKCKNKILFCACCSIFKNEEKLDKFLKDTNAMAVCGYQNNVDWVEATAFELLVLNEMLKSINYSQADDYLKRLEKKLSTISQNFSGIQFIFKTN